MKLFQQLLVAPAALGLLATSANAADLNITSVSDYSGSDEQVTSITQFSDVYPTDWAYQALSNLVEQYGCVAGYPNGTFRGNRAMTRYEAAALLNACLDRITEITDELRRLIKEFESELAILRGRVDGLEARVGELEATQFSTTTKLKGYTNFVFGATNALGDNPKRTSEKTRKNNQKGGYPGAPGGGKMYKGVRSSYDRYYGGTSFSYDLRLGLKTSFTGKDLLFTRLRSGNMGANPFGGAGVRQSVLDTAFNSNNNVKIDRLYYRFPLGRNFTVMTGPLMRNTEAMGYKPTAYGRGGQTQLDFFGGDLGVPGVWTKWTGAGFGAIYSNKANVEKGDSFWTVAANYVAKNGNQGDTKNGGFMTDNSAGSITSQVAYGNKQWGLAAGYRYGQCDTNMRNGTQYLSANAYFIPCNVFNKKGFEKRTGADSHSWSFNAFWRPTDSSWIPSISGSVGTSYTSGDFHGTYNRAGISRGNQFASWMVGLQWSDLFMMGNDLGFAVGQGQFATATSNNDSEDGNYMMELWYQFQVTDNIAITPGVFWLSRPWGQYTPNDKTVGVFGGVVQTVFKF